MSLARLAQLCDVTYQTVQQWEREPPDDAHPNRQSTAPKRSRMPLVAAVLGMTEAHLVTGEDDGGVPLDPKEALLLTYYREMPEDAQDLLIGQASGLHSMTSEPARRSKKK